MAEKQDTPKSKPALKMRVMHLTQNKPQPKYDPLNCRNCGKKFIPNRSWQLDCDTPCHRAYHNQKQKDLRAANRRMDRIEKTQREHEIRIVALETK